MKVVALVSGGKDSCYNMIQCVRYGHEIVALANLYPPNEDQDELDSHMFQTVGHQLIDALADCMDLPMYRAKLMGTSVQTTLTYSSNQEASSDSKQSSASDSTSQAVSTSSSSLSSNRDEIEDLYDLLKLVKSKHPDVMGVSCGAILSNYQRLRVENVCNRLGLTSLSYLWQRNQSELLEEMVNSGLDAIIVKVAVMGLDYRHLGKSLGVLRPHLMSLGAKWGMNVCGEGGEYETFTLDCPLFVKRIVIDKFDTVGGKDAGDGVAYMKPTLFHPEDKQLSPSSTSSSSSSSSSSRTISLNNRPITPYTPLVPNPSYTNRFIPKPSPIHAVPFGEPPTFLSLILPSTQASSTTSTPSLQCTTQSRFIRIVSTADVVPSSTTSSTPMPTTTSSSSSSSSPDTTAITTATRQALSSLIQRLDQSTGVATSTSSSSSTTDAPTSSTSGSVPVIREFVYVDLLVNDMSAFDTANTAYKEYIPMQAAPARACIQPTRDKTYTDNTSLSTNANNSTNNTQTSQLQPSTDKITVSCLALVSPSSSPSSSSHMSLPSSTPLPSPPPPSSSPSRAVLSRLHVQSVSEWAPASIGPYAQSVNVEGILSLAGQIGLIPGQLTLTPHLPIQFRQMYLNLNATLSVLHSSPKCITGMTLYISEQTLRFMNLFDLLSYAAEPYPSASQAFSLLTHKHADHGDHVDHNGITTNNDKAKSDGGVNDDGNDDNVMAKGVAMGMLCREVVRNPKPIPSSYKPMKNKNNNNNNNTSSVQGNEGKTKQGGNADDNDDDSWGYDSLEAQANEDGEVKDADGDNNNNDDDEDDDDTGFVFNAFGRLVPKTSLHLEGEGDEDQDDDFAPLASLCPLVYVSAACLPRQAYFETQVTAAEMDLLKGLLPIHVIDIRRVRPSSASSSSSSLSSQSPSLSDLNALVVTTGIGCNRSLLSIASYVLLLLPSSSSSASSSSSSSSSASLVDIVTTLLESVNHLITTRSINLSSSSSTSSTPSSSSSSSSIADILFSRWIHAHSLPSQSITNALAFISNTNNGVYTPPPPSSLASLLSSDSSVFLPSHGMQLNAAEALRVLRNELLTPSSSTPSQSTRALPSSASSSSSSSSSISSSSSHSSPLLSPTLTDSEKDALLPFVLKTITASSSTSSSSSTSTSPLDNKVVVCPLVLSLKAVDIEQCRRKSLLSS